MTREEAENMSSDMLEAKSPKILPGDTISSVQVGLIGALSREDLERLGRRIIHAAELCEDLSMENVTVLLNIRRTSVAVKGWRGAPPVASTTTSLREIATHGSDPLAKAIQEVYAACLEVRA